MKPEPIRWWEVALMLLLVAIAVTLLLKCNPWR